jgi:hypothetical protein
MCGMGCLLAWGVFIFQVFYLAMNYIAFVNKLSSPHATHLTLSSLTA